MQLSDISKDLAQKAVVSRSLGGVIKAGEYPEWAKSLKDTAEKHYADLKSSYNALPSLAQNAILGGGIGLGAGALSGLFSKKKKLKSMLSHGLLGALGGAGLGAAGTLVMDPKAIEQITGRPSGDSKAMAELRSRVNATGLGNASLLGTGHIAGAGALGVGAGMATNKALTSRRLSNAVLGADPAGRGIRERIIAAYPKSKLINGMLTLPASKKVMGLAGLGAGTLDAMVSGKTPGQTSAELNPVIQSMRDRGLGSDNPQLLAKLKDLSKETTPGWASYVPVLRRFAGGVSNQRANQIIDQLNTDFPQ